MKGFRRTPATIKNPDEFRGKDEPTRIQHREGHQVAGCVPRVTGELVDGPFVGRNREQRRRRIVID
jgi:hypothetical protein